MNKSQLEIQINKANMRRINAMLAKEPKVSATRMFDVAFDEPIPYWIKFKN